MPLAAASMLYPCDLSDGEWAVLGPLLPPAKQGGRPRSVNLRMICNGIFSVLRSGCQWRLLPREYGAWSTVYASFRPGVSTGPGGGGRMHTTLRERLRRHPPCYEQRPSLRSEVSSVPLSDETSPSAS